jgi:UDP-2-acetamido-3-amino-2,3-dideoxy-glucuronate N-acetyltransferase
MSDTPSFYAHPSAVIDDGATIGAGSKVWHFSHVMGGARIGANCVLGQNVYVANTVRIGDGCKIQNNVSLYDGVILEENVFCGPSMVFTNVNTPRAHIERKEAYAPTVVGRGASIGANATVICGNPIGEYAFIGAGAVVTKTVPPHAIVFGAPARVHGFACRCGEKLDHRQAGAICKSCGDRYIISGERCGLQSA